MFVFVCLNWSERGNQRDRDRERAQARSGNKTKQTKTDGLTPEQRRERSQFSLPICQFQIFPNWSETLILNSDSLIAFRDAKALQEKAAKKAAQAQAAGGNNAGGKK